MADIREERLQSLMEVIHAVLLSLEEYRGGAPIHDDWNRVVAGLQNRIASAASWRGPAGVPPSTAFPDAAEHILDRPRTSSRPKKPRAPSDSGELNTVELFLRSGGDESPARPSGTPPDPSPPPEAVRPPASPPPAPAAPSISPELDLARAEARHHAESAATAYAETARLRAECEDLRRRLESAEARARELARAASAASSAAAPASPDPSYPARAQPGAATPGAAVLRALEIEDVFGVGEPLLAAQIAAVSHYLEKTRGNLVHIFQALEIPVRIPPFAEVLRVSLAAGGSEDGVIRHLEQLRNCWKVLVSGTWNNLETTCGRVQESLDPETIEREAKTRRTKPWDFYQERIRGLPIYSVVVESLRAQIRAGLNDPRTGAPDFM